MMTSTGLHSKRAWRLPILSKILCHATFAVNINFQLIMCNGQRV